MWRVYCTGNHLNHKKCSQYSIVSSSTIDGAKKSFDKILFNDLDTDEMRKYWRDRISTDGLGILFIKDLWEDMETITKAAIKNGDRIWSLNKPGRHHDVLAIMATNLVYQLDLDIQGFITSTGRFVDRKEACLIATKAKQILVKTRPLDTLFSEDVW